MSITTEIKTRLYTLVGISDEHTSCDCCGRDNLKRTMVLRPVDGTSADGSFDFVFFGTGCGSKALHWAEGDAPAKKMSADRLLKEAQAAERQRKADEYKAAEERHPLIAEIAALVAANHEFSFRPLDPQGRHKSFREMLAYAKFAPSTKARYDAYITAQNNLYVRRRAAVETEVGHKGF